MQDFLAACRCEPARRVPVWFMRQAGRSLPEYRAARQGRGFFESVADPELAAELTLQPVRRYGVDAAILFSDIMVPLRAIGVDVEIVPDRGPVVASPVRCAADLDRLRPIEPEQDMAYVIDAVRICARELDIPLIGFAGAPFTLASYLIEGGPSADGHATTRAFMHAEPAVWDQLLERLADLSLASLVAQVKAGATAVQLFDSWAGALSPHDYAETVLPAMRRVLDGLEPLGVPRICFGVGAGELLGLMAEAGADVVGVDWRVPLPEARRRCGPGTAVQGNLDPAACLAPWSAVAALSRRVLEEAGGMAGHIFNLGHGVLPGTDPGILAAVVDLVHEEGRAGGR